MARKRTTKKARSASGALPSPDRIYLRPRFVPHEPGHVVPLRRTVWHPKPQAERSLDRLEIRELPDGSVAIPRRHLSLEEAALVPKGRGVAVFRDMNAAMRAMGFYLPKNVKAELKRMHALFDDLRVLHAVSVDHWKTMTDSQRRQFRRRLLKSVELLAKNPALLGAETKIKAFERLVRASELFRAGNSSAAIVSLHGAAHDVLQRYDELLAQRVYLPRRERSIREVKHRREERIFIGLDAVLGQFDRLSRLPILARGEQVRFVQALNAWQRFFGANRWGQIPLFQAAASKLSEAAVLGRTGQWSLCREPLRQACRFIVEEVSKTADLYPDRVRLIRLSTNKSWKQRIVRNQAQLLQDNVEYWSQKGFPSGFGNVSEFFSSWASFCRSEGSDAQARNFVRARTAFGLSDIPGCVAALGRIVKSIPK